MTSWVPTPPNLLPVGVDGGKARMVGWVTDLGVVWPHTPAGTAVVTEGASIWSARPDGAVILDAVPVQEDVAYTAGVTVSSIAALTMTWVTAAGTAGTSVQGIGNGRVTITGTAPAGALGVWIGVTAPQIRIIDDPGETDPDVRILQFPEWLRDPNDPDIVLAGGVGPVTAQYPTIVEGTRDLGPLPPSRATAAALWALVPQVQRAADGVQGQFRRYVDGLSTMLEPAWQTIEDTPTITDPTQVPDVWAGWLSTALGIPTQATPQDARSAIGAWAEAPQPGTAAALSATVRRFLTGGRQVLIRPAPPWAIYIGVRDDECPQGITVLAAQIEATGQVPAGHTLTVLLVATTWDLVDLTYPLWEDSNGLSWAVIDSTGVFLTGDESYPSSTLYPSATLFPS